MEPKVTVVRVEPTPPPINKVVIECSLKMAALIRGVLGGQLEDALKFISSNMSDSRYSTFAKDLRRPEFVLLRIELENAISTAISS